MWLSAHNFAKYFTETLQAVSLSIPDKRPCETDHAFNSSILDMDKPNVENNSKKSP